MNSPRKSHVKRLFLNTWDDLNPRNELTQEVPCEEIVPEHSGRLGSQGRNKLTKEVPCEEIVPEHPWGCEEVVPEHSGRLGSQGRNELTQEVPCEQIVPEHSWGCEEIVPEHSGGLGSQGRNELTQEVPCEEIVPYQSVRLEAKEEMNSPRKSHVNRLFLNTLEDVKRLFTLEDLNWKRNELTQEVPCEQIVPEHSGGFEAKEGMNSPRKFHVKRLFLNTLGDLKPRKEWTHPGSPMWTDCSSTLWRTWTQKRNELTQEVPCEQIVSEHYGGLEAKEGMNSPRKSHVNRLFLNTQEDSKPRKEWAHPGSPMWTDCFWTPWRTWSQGRNELTQEVPCKEVVSEHSGGFEPKEGMNSPRKSHVKRLFLNTWDDLKPRKEWTHPGSPMWRDCFWTPWRTWTHGRNELTQEVPCEEVVSEHMRWLEAKEGMNSPRKSHVKRLFLNTLEDLNPRKEWTHPGSPMWTDCSLTICKTWSQGRNELTQEVPCEEIVPEHPWGCEEVVPEHSGRLEAKEGMNSQEWTRKSHVKRLFLNTLEDVKRLFLNTLEDLEAKEGMNSPRKSMWTDCSWTFWRTWTQKRNELTQEVPCEQIVSEHYGGLEAKEGMNSPRKSHVKRLSWTHEMTWSQGRNELIQEVPCEEIVSEHPGGLEPMEGMNSPRKSHVKKLFLNTWDDLKQRKE